MRLHRRALVAVATASLVGFGAAAPLEAKPAPTKTQLVKNIRLVGKLVERTANLTTRVNRLERRVTTAAGAPALRGEPGERSWVSAGSSSQRFGC